MRLYKNLENQLALSSFLNYLISEGVALLYIIYLYLLSPFVLNHTTFLCTSYYILTFLQSFIFPQIFYCHCFLN